MCVCLCSKMCHTLIHNVCYSLIHNARHSLIHNVRHSLIHNACHPLIHNVCHSLIRNVCHSLIHNVCHPDMTSTPDLTFRMTYLCDQLYKEEYLQRKERRKSLRNRHQILTGVPPWLNPPPGHFPPLAPPPYAGGIIGGDYDLNPEFASGELSSCSHHHLTGG